MKQFLIFFMASFTLLSIAAAYIVFFFWLLYNDRWVIALIALILPVSLIMAAKSTIDSLDNK